MTYSPLNPKSTLTEIHNGIAFSFNMTDMHKNYIAVLTISCILTSPKLKLTTNATKTHSLRKTLSYDPAKSETFKALQEAELGDTVQEVTVPAQTRVFSPSAQVKVMYQFTFYDLSIILEIFSYYHNSVSIQIAEYK
jgi:hypothetical protein